MRRNASSRSAIRFGLRKNRSTRRADFFRHVDLAGVQAREQIVGRQVDELDLVGLVEDAVRHRLALLDAGDLRDQIVQALEMLDVERGPDVDAGVEQLLDVLPTLRMARRGIAADEVGVGELVDEQDGRRRRFSAASRSNSWRTMPR